MYTRKFYQNVCISWFEYAVNTCKCFIHEELRPFLIGISYWFNIKVIDLHIKKKIMIVKMYMSFSLGYIHLQQIALLAQSIEIWTCRWKVADVNRDKMIHVGQFPQFLIFCPSHSNETQSFVNHLMVLTIYYAW